MTDENIIYCDQLCIGYKKRESIKTIQHNLHLEVNVGELICLIGPNGCGKSTLIKTLVGILPKIAGEIRIFGHPMEEIPLKKLASYISTVLTDNIYNSTLTVKQVVEMGRIPFTNWLGVTKDHDKEIVLKSIADVDLTHKKDEFFHNLSDGEKQRVMIAKALAQETPVIILDEATAHLDIQNRVKIMILLKQLAQKYNKSIIISTHELELALQCADIIWLMTPNGIICAPSTSTELLEQIKNLFNSENINFDINSRSFCIKH